MLKTRRGFNPKRKIAETVCSTRIERLVACVTYGGNPEHKRNPGDFGLTPPATPRAHKTLCDQVGIVKKQVALDLLKRGIRAGLVSQQEHNGFPQNIWSVDDDGNPLEAQLENVEKGTYHGYPIPQSDPFREKVLEIWKKAQS